MQYENLVEDFRGRGDLLCGLGRPFSAVPEHCTVGFRAADSGELPLRKNDYQLGRKENVATRLPTGADRSRFIVCHIDSNHCHRFCRRICQVR